MLSDDECKTWKYKLLLDERTGVSYPDAKESDDGYIYITYDRERGAYLDSLDQVYSQAREILLAKITENDIINGKIVDEESKLKCVISKLGEYALESENPFNEEIRLDADALAQKISGMSRNEVMDFIVRHYGLNCASMHIVENAKLDMLIENWDTSSCDREEVARNILSLLNSITERSPKEVPIVNRVKSLMQDHLQDDLSVKEISERLGMSMYYMCHLFKRETGITIVDYKKELKIIKAKDLLVNTDKRITDIAQECGFGGDSYFCKVFLEHELLSPTQYRTFCKKKVYGGDK